MIIVIKINQWSLSEKPFLKMRSPVDHLTIESMKFLCEMPMWKWFCENAPVKFSFETTVLKMMFWKCCSKNAGMKMLFWKCCSENAVLKMLVWKCWSENALLKLIFWKCSYENPSVKMVFLKIISSENSFVLNQDYQVGSKQWFFTISCLVLMAMARWAKWTSK